MIAPAPSHSLLAVSGLCFSRDTQPVFGPLNFSVDAGEALLVQGDNGAGKTTLLRVLAGLLPAQSGTVVRSRNSPSNKPRAHVIAYLAHLSGLKGDLTALENLSFACGLHGHRPGQQPASAMALAGLADYEDTPLRLLSAGQKKRLSLARLWLSPARLWLLDEPYANLDLDGINLVNRMISAHLHDDGAALVTTHGAYAPPPVRTRVLVMTAPQTEPMA